MQVEVNLHHFQVHVLLINQVNLYGFTLSNTHYRRWNCWNNDCSTTSKEKKSYPDPNIDNATVVKLLQQKYTAAFYSETFKIPLDRVDDFIYFVGEREVTHELMQAENEIDLLELLFQQSERYKALIEDK